jgi:hypothetical protein
MNRITPAGEVNRETQQLPEKKYKTDGYKFRKGAFLPCEVMNLMIAGVLSPTDTVVLAAIDALCQDNRIGCYSSNDYLAATVKKSTSQVSRIVSKLTDLDLIVVETRRRPDNSPQRHIWTRWSRWDHQDELPDEAFADPPDDAVPPPPRPKPAAKPPAPPPTARSDVARRQDSPAAGYTGGEGWHPDESRFHSKDYTVVDEDEGVDDDFDEYSDAPPCASVRTPPTHPVRTPPTHPVRTPPTHPVRTIRGQGQEEERRGEDEKIQSARDPHPILNEGTPPNRTVSPGPVGDAEQKGSTPPGAESLAKTLYDALLVKRRIVKKVTPTQFAKNWVREIAELVSVMGLDEVNTVLIWYAAYVHTEGDFVPKVNAATTFVEKYVSIRDAWERAHRTQKPHQRDPGTSNTHSVRTPILLERVDPYTKEIDWPRDCASQVPDLIERSYASLAPFWDFLNFPVDALGDAELTEFSRLWWNDLRSVFDFIAIDLENLAKDSWHKHRTWKPSERTSGWNGRVQPTTLESQRFREIGISVAADLVGTDGGHAARLWDRAVAAYEVHRRKVSGGAA